jgi:hypothetical protein
MLLRDFPDASFHGAASAFDLDAIDEAGAILALSNSGH